MVLVRLDVSQVIDLAHDLRGNAAVTEPRAREIVEKGGHDTVAAIQQAIRDVDAIDTGNMLNSTSVDFHGMGFEAGPTVEYGIYVNNGTSKMAGRDFMGMGADMAFPQIEDALGQLGIQVIRRAR